MDKEHLKYCLKVGLSSLNDDSTVNPEYTRGQVELAMDLLGYTEETEEALRRELMAAADFENYGEEYGFRGALPWSHRLR